MIPKKHKEFKEGIAKELGIHENVVDDFLSFYYSKIRTSLSSLDYPKIQVDGLGTFSIRKNKLEQKIKKYKDILGNTQKQTYKGYAKSVEIAKKLEEMETALETLEEMYKRKKNFKK